ncbi:MAG: hypothetical protein ACXU82_19910 [Caulobacteraceae bacterium]
MSHKSPARRALSQFRRVLRAVGLMEASAPSVRNAGKRVRARRSLAAASARLVTA